MLKKICRRCGTRLNPGERCKCLGTKINTKQRMEKYDKTKRNPTAMEFYKSTKWHKTRAKVIAIAGGLDEWALSRGIVQPGSIVHHIIPRAEDPERALDVDNLILLSPQSHAIIHIWYDKSPEEKARIQAELLRITHLRGFAWEG